MLSGSVTITATLQQRQAGGSYQCASRRRRARRTCPVYGRRQGRGHWAGCWLQTGDVLMSWHSSVSGTVC